MPKPYHENRIFKKMIPLEIVSGNRDFYTHRCLTSI